MSFFYKVFQESLSKYIDEHKIVYNIKNQVINDLVYKFIYAYTSTHREGYLDFDYRFDIAKLDGADKLEVYSSLVSLICHMTDSSSCTSLLTSQGSNHYFERITIFDVDPDSTYSNTFNHSYIRKAIKNYAGTLNKHSLIDRAFVFDTARFVKPNLLTLEYEDSNNGLPNPNHLDMIYNKILVFDKSIYNLEDQEFSLSNDVEHICVMLSDELFYYYIVNLYNSLITFKHYVFISKDSKDKEKDQYIKSIESVKKLIAGYIHNLKNLKRFSVNTT